MISKFRSRFRTVAALAIMMLMSFLTASAQTHPCLLFSAEDEATLREKLADSDEVSLKMHALVMEKADKSLRAKPLLYKKDKSGKRILEVSRAALWHISACAYAYRMTGDVKYLEKAEEDLQAVCKFKNWNANRHFLDAAEMALAVAVGYDWLYDAISPDLKALIRNAVMNYAFLPARGPKGFYDRINNWNEVCNGGLIMAAIGIYGKDDPHTKLLIESALENNRKVLQKLYAPDGNFEEGPTYWNFGTTYEAFMLYTMETQLGTDYGLYDSEGFDKTPVAQNFMYGATKKLFNFADCPEKEISSSALWYFAWKQKDPSLLFNEVRMLRDGKYSCRVQPLLMGFVAKVDTKGISVPGRHFFKGRGITPVVIVRGDWSSSPTDSYLGIKGGKASASHAHMDAGSFIYDAYGYRWSMDYTRAAYDVYEAYFKENGGSLWSAKQDSRRWEIFRYNNFQHSTLTINESRHKVDGKAEFTEYYESERWKGGKLDMTPVFEGEAAGVFRAVTISDDSSLKVVDEVESLKDKPAKVRWTMITPAQVKITGKGILLTQGGVTLKLSVSACGAKVKYRSWSSDPADYDYPLSKFEKKEPGVSHVGFEAVVPPGRKAMFTTNIIRNSKR